MIFWFLLPLLGLGLVVGMAISIVVFLACRRAPDGPNRFGAPSKTRGPLGAIGNGLVGYFNFNARSNRWDFLVFAIITGCLCLAGFLAPFALFNMGVEYSRPWLPLSLFFGAPLLLTTPSLAMAARRLHDGNRSGWWLLLLLCFGYFILLYWFLQPPQRSTSADVF